MNFQRGFHRLLIIFVVLWALLCTIGFPLGFTWYIRAHAWDMYQRDLRDCFDPAETYPTCVEDAEKYWKMETSGDSSILTFNRELWWVELTAIFIPTGLLYAIFYLIVWVSRGFAPRVGHLGQVGTDTKTN